MPENTFQNANAEEDIITADELDSLLEGLFEKQRLAESVDVDDEILAVDGNDQSKQQANTNTILRLSTAISETKLVVRVKNAFTRAGLVTIGDLIKNNSWTDAYNLGVKSAEDAKDYLVDHSLTVPRKSYYSDDFMVGLTAFSAIPDLFPDMFGFLAKWDKGQPLLVQESKAEARTGARGHKNTHPLSKESIFRFDHKKAMELSELSIKDLSLPFPTENVLVRNGITTIGKLLEQSEASLIEMHGFGIKKLYDIQEALQMLITASDKEKSDLKRKVAPLQGKFDLAVYSASFPEEAYHICYTILEKLKSSLGKREIDGDLFFLWALPLAANLIVNKSDEDDIENELMTSLVMENSFTELLANIIERRISKESGAFNVSRLISVLPETVYWRELLSRAVAKISNEYSHDQLRFYLTTQSLHNDAFTDDDTIQGVSELSNAYGLLQREKTVLDKIGENHIVSYADIVRVLDNDAATAEQVLASLVRDKSIEFCSEGIRLCGDPGRPQIEFDPNEPKSPSGEIRLSLQPLTYLSLHDWIDSLPDIERDLLFSRFSGKTLEEVGHRLGITRERVRQKERNILSKRPPLDEDKYGELFGRYALDEDIFISAFNESRLSFAYLKRIYRKSDLSLAKPKNLPLATLSDDESISPEQRAKVIEAFERKENRRYVTIFGTKVERNRDSILQYVVERTAKKTTDVRELMEEYNSRLLALGIDPAGEAFKLGSPRALLGVLSRKDCILTSTKERLKFYEFSAYDYNKLIDCLKVEENEGYEYSTYRFFNDNSDIMAAYNIDDEYELHGLLRQITELGLVNGLGFSRSPMFGFGEYSRDEQVVRMIREQTPIKVEEFAKLYEQRYGVKVGTFTGSWKRDFSTYIKDGHFVYSNEKMTLEEADYLRQELTKDYYTISEVESEFKKRYPDRPLAILNYRSMKDLGFEISEGLIFKQGIDPVEFFNRLLLKEDVFSLKDIDPAIQNNNRFRQELAKLERRFALIEFDRDEYSNISRFKSAGFGAEDFEDYVQKALEFIPPYKGITIKKLKALGFTHKLDSLGLTDFFYSSVLLKAATGGRIKHSIINGTRLFCITEGSYSIGDLIEEIITEMGSQDIYFLQEHLEKEYGITSLPHRQIGLAVKKTKLYYNETMERIFPDYESYIKEMSNEFNG